MIEKHPERGKYEYTGSKNEEPVERIVNAEHPHPAAKDLRNRHRKAVAAPYHERKIIEHKGKAQGQKHLTQFVATDKAQEALIENQAYRRDCRHRSQTSERETTCAARHHEADITAEQ